ncbi:DNA/RNA non-specific endonuclease [Treponema sp. Marseille-Q3903]|uniref:DNA/RNA non-specific endonuclease n=1 Tax=Treponema sp. Marseille-Q3903 TaxID=2766703 RepID=UPI0016528556|nr:DNA/RNA non-specific endonuclease [Treponema sp. Marseille-Q3903]MBC6713190.1 DNA/RNA non-specific endonuclease [Treponema sp. Marseille-Q3903]
MEYKESANSMKLTNTTKSTKPAGAGAKSKSKSTGFSKQSIAVFIFFILSVTVFAQENTPLYFGNPSKASSDLFAENAEENYLMEKKQFSMSYNNKTLEANWVAWHLCATDIGDSGRSNKFIPDQSLPSEWYKVKKEDYQYNAYGFDRGHICPSADRTATSEDNQATFLMTNMIPQSPDCNRITWKNLESYERELALSGNELYIFAGPVGSGGTSGRGYFDEIKLENNERSIKVPEFCWKIILILPEGEDDISRITQDTHVISVCVPNKQGCHVAGDWDIYKCSINYIEEITNFDFFDILPDDLEEYLEEKQ